MTEITVDQQTELHTLIYEIVDSGVDPEEVLYDVKMVVEGLIEDQQND